MDILGKAILDYMKGIRGKTFVIRDDGFKSREKIERYFKYYSEWSKVEREILDSIEGPVLEIGCNIGMHLKYLKEERGLEVCGIDISPTAIMIARKNGLNCYVMDARRMIFSKKYFKTILILYYGFGLAGTIEEQKNMLRDIYKITTDDAVLIASSIDPLATNNPVHLAYQEFNKERGKPYGDITQVTLRIKHDDEFGDWYNLLFINPNGVKKLLEGTGWKLEKAIQENERAWFYIIRK